MTDDQERFGKEGIHIDRDLADEIAIEEELDSNVLGTFLFPSPERRRLAGWVFVVAAAVSLLTIEGGWIVAVGLGLLALWQFLSAWPLSIDENQAMTIAGGAVEFPVGHASAAVRFQGWRSRPRWAVVLYSATEPPDQRGLVVVDAVNGTVAETPYVETIAAV